MREHLEGDDDRRRKQEQSPSSHFNQKARDEQEGERRPAEMAAAIGDRSIPMVAIGTADCQQIEGTL
jgi:hypothetical protein